MCAVFRFWMYSHVEASGVRKRFCDCALPETWRSPNRSVARADRGETPSPTVVTSPARTITHRRRYVMPPSLLLQHDCCGESRLASAESHPIAMEGDAVRHLGKRSDGPK